MTNPPPGAIASISLVGVPGALLASPSSSTATVWAEFFARGVSIMPKVAVISAAAYLYAAYNARQRGAAAAAASPAWKGFAAAAALAVAIVPYTQLFMSGTNALLHAAARGTGAAGADEVRILVGRWAALNLGRSLLPLAGAVAGLMTLFQNGL